MSISMEFEYDASHDKCPLVFVKTKLILKQLQPKQQFWLKLTDAASKKDVIHYLKQHQFHYRVQKQDAHSVELIISG